MVAPGHAMLARVLVTDADLLSERQIVVAGRDSGQVDKRIAISRLQWKGDSPAAALALALALVTAGLGWPWLPAGFVQAPLGTAAARFVAILNLQRASGVRNPMS